MDIVAERRCSKCGETKPVADFHRNGRFNGGYSYSCKPCVLAYSKTYRDENRAKVRAANQAYYWAHVETLREQSRARSKARYQADLATNRATLAARSHERRSRLRGRPTENVTLARLIERDRGRCQICGKAKGAGRWSVDHILPVSQGGANTYANTRLAHLTCNQSRANRGAAQLRLIG